MSLSSERKERERYREREREREKERARERVRERKRETERDKARARERARERKREREREREHKLHFQGLQIAPFSLFGFMCETHYQYIGMQDSNTTPTCVSLPFADSSESEPR